MASETEIANVALRAIGASRITSMTDGSDEQVAVSDIYAELRDELLRSHPWNFATKRVQLARSSSTPAFGYDYAYVLPSDWLKSLSAHDNDDGVGSIASYKDETIGTVRTIQANEENVYLRYVAQITDPNLMPPDFRRALAMGLARDLAIPLAGSNTLRETCKDEALRALARAKSADAQDAPPEVRPEGSWVSSRAGWGGSPFDTRNR